VRANTTPSLPAPQPAGAGTPQPRNYSSSAASDELHFTAPDGKHQNQAGKTQENCLFLHALINSDVTSDSKAKQLLFKRAKYGQSYARLLRTDNLPAEEETEPALQKK